MKLKRSGIFILLLGMILVIGAVFLSMFLLIYGIPLFIIGIIILYNKKEDQIEKVNYKGGKK